MVTDIEKELLQNVLRTTPDTFNEVALAVYHFQYEHNPIYQQFCHTLGKIPTVVRTVADIPFLPIELFKTNRIATTQFAEATIFESSGTTGSVNSKHYVKDLSLYEASFLQTFNSYYGKPNQYCIIGLLPSYLQRSGSSLVYMVQQLITQSANPTSGFYLDEFDKLKKVLIQHEQNKQPTLLIGVSYALLYFAEQNKLQLKYTTIIETGGMKGRREPISRAALHHTLQQQFGVPSIHSEYGMTELLSQAYSAGNGIFTAPPYMRIYLRREDDPLTLKTMPTNATKMSGVINCIDLANLYSCAFIATDDLGILYADNSFEITGRMLNSDVRGCSLMLA